MLVSFSPSASNLYLCLHYFSVLILSTPTDTLQTLSPLVNKVLLTWLVDAYVYHRLSDEERAAGIIKQPRGIGYGVGLAFALFVMQGQSFLYSVNYVIKTLECRSRQFGTSGTGPLNSMR